MRHTGVACRAWLSGSRRPRGLSAVAPRARARRGQARRSSPGRQGLTPLPRAGRCRAGSRWGLLSPGMPRASDTWHILRAVSSGVQLWVIPRTPDRGIEVWPGQDGSEGASCDGRHARAIACGRQRTRGCATTPEPRSSFREGSHSLARLSFGSRGRDSDAGRGSMSGSMSGCARGMRRDSEIRNRPVRSI